MSVAVERHRVSDEELAALAAATPSRLIRGRMLLCPGCLNEHDILDYRPYNYNEDYADELVPPLKCRCGHIFALRDPQGGVDGV